MGHDSADLQQSTLRLLVLRALSDGPKHGHEIMRWIRERADDELRIEEGAIYPTLHRLHGDRLVDAAWGVTENSRKAKYYELTDRGLARLEKDLGSWERYVSVVSNVLRPA